MTLQHLFVTRLEILETVNVNYVTVRQAMTRFVQQVNKESGTPAVAAWLAHREHLFTLTMDDIVAVIHSTLSNKVTMKTSS